MWTQWTETQQNLLCDKIFNIEYDMASFKRLMETYSGCFLYIESKKPRVSPMFFLMDTDFPIWLILEFSSHVYLLKDKDLALSFGIRNIVFEGKEEEFQHCVRSGCEYRYKDSFGLVRTSSRFMFLYHVAG